MLTAFGGIFIFANILLTKLFKNPIFTFGNDEFVKTGGGGLLKSRGNMAIGVQGYLYARMS